MSMKKGFLYQNSLTIVFFLFFLVSIIGQFFTGFKEYNEELKDDHARQLQFLNILPVVILFHQPLKTGRVNFCRWPYLLS